MIVGFCVWSAGLGFSAEGLQSLPRTNEASNSPRVLQRADLLGLLDCATRTDQRLAVRTESYGEESFRLRYVYPLVVGRKANMLNMLAPDNWVAMVLYHRDGHSAALFEVGFDGPASRRTFALLDGANLEKQGEGWVVKDI